ncbi:MAG TPA: hypothetical protein VMT19_00925 [Thermoanaerobaculaceae bacterium]|nr:hypothetical protein [Thermoanaerobaculaceae bacterium]
MKLQAELTVNGKKYPKGSDVPWYTVYPFFLVHMLVFGGSGFFMAYSDQRPPLGFLYLHGGFAILIYTAFYLTMFGRDEVKWMFINAGLGVLGIYGQLGWLLAKFGKRIADYPLSRSVIPFFYYVLYTFLLRHALLDLTGSREDEDRKQKVEYSYIVLSVLVSLLFYYLDHRHARSGSGW